MIAYIKLESEQFLIKTRYHEKINSLYESIKCEQTIIGNNVRAFPLDKLDDVTNGLLNLNVRIHDCSQLPIDSSSNGRIFSFYI